MITRFICTLVLATLLLSPSAHAWWDKNYTVRQPVTIDTTPEGAAITTPVDSPVALVRLHEGNFQFLAAREDGSDIRFVAEDDKTLLPFHIEKYDSLLNEGFVWVQLPKLEPGAKLTLWLYYGAATPGEGGGDSAKTYDASTLLAYHFAERGTPPVDATASASNADKAGLAVEGSLIGTGLRLDGRQGLTVPANEKLTWPAGGPLSFSVWARPASIEGRRALLSYKEGDDSVVVGIEAGVPFVEVNNSGVVARTPAGDAIPENTWQHIGFVAAEGNIELFVSGRSYGKVEGAVPAMNSGIVIGALSAEPDEQTGFVEELDEMRLARAAWNAGAFQFAAANQGTSPDAAKVLAVGEPNSAAHGGHNATLEHVMLFGDIASNMMFDGWIAVGVCVLMIILGWTVAIRKFSYLNSIQKGSDAFIRQWKHMSTDLTALDHDDEESVKTMGGGADKKLLRHMHRSPLYHLYEIGSEEIRHRLGRGKDSSRGLSARSIQAIRAALESGLVRENQRMNKGLILLTISIAGGPYVGLLGTVVGVMITFAIIARSGEVEVNSIAPGIASALLATVAGLVVAIPALFIYSYLSTRIRDLLAAMQVFIDEFVAKMAEFYPTPADVAASGGVPSRAIEPSNSNNHHDEPCKPTPERATTTSM